MKDIEVVITSYNQKEMIEEALDSVRNQTVLPERIIIIDDGSRDASSLEVLKKISQKDSKIPITIYYQENSGVSAARNTGISKTNSKYVLILDGDDRLKPTYIEKVINLLEENESVVAASSWMETFGVLQSIVKPSGGTIIPFLARNCCPATHIVRKSAWEKSNGYDETMRSGFEDWEYFLGLLETSEDAQIKIAPEALIEYRTVPVSSNIKSMEKRLELMHYLMEKHKDSYSKNFIDAILGIEKISMNRLSLWEQEILHKLDINESSEDSKKFLESPSYGDGGMASVVRIRTVESAAE
ncbi:Glycosyltransferase involved in cell wall biogenesis [Lachnospiraceae bacterium TWA4]|nr:Glycosyltransferase involved in cell wall biogenesis [Lachnospiraceae bacterium TWA4]